MQTKIFPQVSIRAVSIQARDDGRNGLEYKIEGTVVASAQKMVEKRGE
jgi:hypothetical protein